MRVNQFSFFSTCPHYSHVIRFGKEFDYLHFAGRFVQWTTAISTVKEVDSLQDKKVSRILQTPSHTQNLPP